MPTVSYNNAVIDLSKGADHVWEHIRARNEVRKAEKSGVRVETYQGLSEELFSTCQNILKNLLAKRRVPYDAVFDALMRDPNRTCLVAFVEDKAVSFIVVGEREISGTSGGVREGVLLLSATDPEYASLCPNYLLIWSAIQMLADKKIPAFNLGLLTYADAPDPDLESVAFFKKKWLSSTETNSEAVSIPKYLYLKYLKRFRSVKTVLWMMKRIIHSRG